MATLKKQEIVKDLTEKVSRAKALVLADYTGLTHKQLEELRRALKKTDAELTVTKNRLLAKALTGAKRIIDASTLTGNTATLFAYGDEVSPLKELTKLFKNWQIGKIKNGLLGETQLSADQVKRLAGLPSKPELYTQLAAYLKGPIFGLHYGLKWNLNRLVYALNAYKSLKSN